MKAHRTIPAEARHLIHTYKLDQATSIEDAVTRVSRIIGCPVEVRHVDASPAGWWGLTWPTHPSPTTQNVTIVVAAKNHLTHSHTEFTIAHELGHLVADAAEGRPIEPVHRCCEQASTRIEQLAEAFAAHLLMTITTNTCSPAERLAALGRVL